MRAKVLTLAVAGLLMLATGIAQATDRKTIEIVIKDHLFKPDRIELTAGVPHILIVKNQDATPEEFESHDLRLEKVVRGNGKIKIALPPLKPGTYKFVGEFHEDTAKGSIVVKAPQ